MARVGFAENAGSTIRSSDRPLRNGTAIIKRRWWWSVPFRTRGRFARIVIIYGDSGTGWILLSRRDSDGKRSRGRLITRECRMGVVEVAALRPCPVPASPSFPPCVRVRAFTDTLLLYNYTLRRAISYKLAYIRARAPLRYSRNAAVHVRERHLHVAGTSFAAILITRLSSGGKHEFRSRASSSPDRYRSVASSRHATSNDSRANRLCSPSSSSSLLFSFSIVEKLFRSRTYIGRM